MIMYRGYHNFGNSFFNLAQIVLIDTIYGSMARCR